MDFSECFIIISIFAYKHCVYLVRLKKVTVVSHLHLLGCSWRTNLRLLPCNETGSSKHHTLISFQTLLQIVFPARCPFCNTSCSLHSNTAWRFLNVISAPITDWILVPVCSHHEKECTPSWTLVHLAPKSRESQRPPCKTGNRAVFALTLVFFMCEVSVCGWGLRGSRQCWGPPDSRGWGSGTWSAEPGGRAAVWIWTLPRHL